MKKFLLLAATSMMVASSAFAAVDNAEYEGKDGLFVKSKWMKTLNSDIRTNSKEFASLPFSGSNYARTAVVVETRIYVAESKPTIVTEGDKETTYNYATLHVFDLETGELLRSTTLTNDGQPIRTPAPLSFNQIGVDNFGNFWGCGYTTNPNTSSLKPYVIDIETGAVTYVPEVKLPDDEAAVAGRVDFPDVVGDITAKEGDAILMAVPHTSAEAALNVYRWRRAQGSDEWVGDFDGYVAQPVDDGQSGLTAWKGATLVKIVDDPDNSGEYFYIDDNATRPTLYNTTGEAVDGFFNADASKVAFPTIDPVGVCEFTIGERPMIAWVHNQYDKSYDADVAEAGGCVIRVGKLGEGQTFSDLEEYWLFPKEGMGIGVSDGGNRIHNIATHSMVDENGKEGVLLLSFKCRNGLACYLIAEDGFIDSVESVATDNAEVVSTSYYNTLGQRIANPEAGQVCVKVATLSNGKQVASKVVR